MAHWKCSNCGYQLQEDEPPETCPSCHDNCAFTDITCYIPECGGDANIDPRLASS